jgi:hypothetical protein
MRQRCGRHEHHAAGSKGSASRPRGDRGDVPTAATTLAETVPPELLAADALYPSVSALRPVSRAIAARILAAARPELTLDAALAEVDASTWAPQYVPYRPA